MLHICLKTQCGSVGQAKIKSFIKSYSCHKDFIKIKEKVTEILLNAWCINAVRILLLILFLIPESPFY